MDDDREDHYELVLPFVACQSKGGPYEDSAFVAGFQLGALDATLTKPDCEMTSQVVPAALREQVDLLAMHRGYRMTYEPWDDGQDYAHVYLYKVRPGDDVPV